jgi:hypothetical protein
VLQESDSVHAWHTAVYVSVRLSHSSVCAHFGAYFNAAGSFPSMPLCEWHYLLPTYQTYALPRPGCVAVCCHCRLQSALL